MPWKKNFDEEEALENAMKVFWEKGYASTSISDLTKATGVQRQSLYNAFGNKRKLFIRSLLKYNTDRRQQKLAMLESRGKPLESIQAMFAMVAEQSMSQVDKRGCFLVNTALSLPAHDDEVHLLVTSAIEDFRAFFKRLIEHAKVREELPATVDTDAVASGLLAAVMGIRVMSRGSGNERVIRQAADQALRLLGAPASLETQGEEPRHAKNARV